MAIYKISPAAEKDLVDIYVRGHKEWGVTQADDFQIKLVSTFRTLVDNPYIGREVSISPQLLRHELKPYVIFYRKFSYGVRIARILYKNRAMEKHL